MIHQSDSEICTTCNRSLLYIECEFVISNDISDSDYNLTNLFYCPNCNRYYIIKDELVCINENATLFIKPNNSKHYYQLNSIFEDNENFCAYKNPIIGAEIFHNIGYGRGIISAFNKTNIIVRFDKMGIRKLRIEPNTIGFYTFSDVKLQRFFLMLANKAFNKKVECFESSYGVTVKPVRNNEEPNGKPRIESAYFIVRKVYFYELLDNGGISAEPFYTSDDFVINNSRFCIEVLKSINEGSTRLYYCGTEYKIELDNDGKIANENKPIKLPINAVVWVYKKSTSIVCARKHRIKPAVAIVTTKEGITVEIDIHRCRDCDETYFVSEEVLRGIEEQYGELNIINRSYESDYEIPYEDTEFGDDSMLTRYGYHAGKNDSDEWRHNKLIEIIESKRMTVAEVVEDLENFFEDRRQQKRHPDPCRKRRDDRNFIRKYYRDSNADVIENPTLMYKYGTDEITV